MSYGEADCNHEEWRAVVGYEGVYEISSKGRVKRVGGGKGATVGAILRPYRLPNGYYRVILYPKRPGQSGYLHHLVGEAFLGPCPESLERNHKDGDKSNNTPGNIEYVTHAENLRHAKRNGLIRRGSQKSEAKLNECLVRMAVLSLNYETGATVARIFGINRSTLQNIQSGQTWKHVTSPGLTP